MSDNRLGYVIKVGAGYVRWSRTPSGLLQAWSIMAEAADATVYMTAAEAMSHRPNVEGHPKGLVVLLRSCVH